MNNHDELSYIKIMTRIIGEMSKETEKLRRELIIHRFIFVIQFVLIIILLLTGAK